jgi:hypothetical protein
MKEGQEAQCPSCEQMRSRRNVTRGTKKVWCYGTGKAWATGVSPHTLELAGGGLSEVARVRSKSCVIQTFISCVTVQPHGETSLISLLSSSSQF